MGILYTTDIVYPILIVTGITLVTVILFHRDLRCELAKLKKAIDELKEKK